MEINLAEKAQHDKLVALVDSMHKLQKKHQEARMERDKELYRAGKRPYLETSLASDTAQLTLWDSLYELGKRKTSYIHIAVDELQEEHGKI